MEQCEALRNLGWRRLQGESPGGATLFMCRLSKALISEDALPQVPLRSTWGYSWCRLSELAFQQALVSLAGHGYQRVTGYNSRKRSAIDNWSVPGDA